MKYIIPALLVILWNGASGQWKTTTPFGTTINDIIFTDRYTGYAVFQAQGIGSCMTTSAMYKTIDEGVTWIRMNTGNTNPVNAVHFVNQLTGWITTSSSEIRKTTDGGVTWIQQSSGVGSGINDIWFKDLNNGFVAGNNGMLRKSSNGGNNWQTIASGVTTSLRKIFFINNTLGFIACGNGQVLRTADGGNSWAVISTGAPGLNDIFFVTPQLGFAVSANTLYMSQDGGLGWGPANLTSTTPMLRIYFRSPLIGYVTVDGQGVFRTRDGGNSWSLVATQNGLYDTWYGIYFTDDNTGYICGNLGRINKTTDGGLSWANTVTGLGQELYTVSAPHKDTAYFGSKSGKIYKTENGGISLYQQVSAFPSVINRLYFLNPSTGFTCSDSGRILKTIDGGRNWKIIPTNSFRGITGFSFIDADHGFAAATGGLVFRTSDNGENWDSLNTGFNEDYRAIWFSNADSGYVISHDKIVHTYDGGQTWASYTSLYAGSLADIVFTNDSLGYCAGGFGKFLFTTDAGMNWDTCNAGSQNAEIRAMSALNDSTIYFARYGSQSITTDSCKTLHSTSTACLANNGPMNSIAMVGGGSHGYAAGGLNGVVHQLETREIIRTYTSDNTYCPGSTVFIGYHARGMYNAGNIFKAQLSDASGSFANPADIGIYNPLHLVYQAGIITASFPPGLTPGNYRIRVVSSDPVVIGNDNGYDIGISPSFTPAVSIKSNKPHYCTGDRVILTASAYAGGLNPDFQWFLNGILLAVRSKTIVLDSLHDGDSITVSMQSDLACASPATAQSGAWVAAFFPPPVFSLGPDTAVCSATYIQLNAPAGFKYQWYPSTGLNSTTIANPVAAIPGNIQYRLLITDSVGCSSTDSINITAWVLPPDFSLGNDTAVCTGDTIFLSAPPGYYYSWSPVSGLNDTTSASPFAVVSGNITYSATISDTNACIRSDTINITAFPLPLGPVITQNGNILVSSPAYAYQWYLDSIAIPGATDSIYIPQVSGSYTVLVFNEAGCSSLSLPFQVIIGGAVDLCEYDLKYFPNPVDETLNISFKPGISGRIEISVLDMTGRIMILDDYLSQERASLIQVNAGSLPSGIYFCRIHTDVNIFGFRFVR